MSIFILQNKFKLQNCIKFTLKTHNFSVKPSINYSDKLINGRNLQTKKSYHNNDHKFFFMNKIGILFFLCF